ncbi:MAG: esterase [Nitrospirae bacterium]|nr:MAG: esterase [Nitrospirota bacterium]
MRPGIRTETFAGLTVRIAGGRDGRGGGDGPLVCLLHGFGAPGDDLVPLAEALESRGVLRFAFPAAPIELAMGWWEARAWWEIDVAELERTVAAGTFRDLEGRDPPELPRVRGQLLEALEGVQQALGVRPEQVVIGGFSQGAMLATDTFLAGERPFAGLAILSGTFLAAERWRRLMGRRAGLPFFQSHGRSDPLLPFALAQRLRDALAAAGLRPTWCDFPGGHQIPPAVVTRLAAFLHDVAAGGHRG